MFAMLRDTAHDTAKSWGTTDRKQRIQTQQCDRSIVFASAFCPAIASSVANRQTTEDAHRDCRITPPFLKFPSSVRTERLVSFICQAPIVWIPPTTLLSLLPSYLFSRADDSGAANHFETEQHGSAYSPKHSGDVSPGSLDSGSGRGELGSSSLLPAVLRRRFFKNRIVTLATTLVLGPTKGDSTSYCLQWTLLCSMQLAHAAQACPEMKGTQSSPSQPDPRSACVFSPRAPDDCRSPHLAFLTSTP